ncbi:DUF805 domain-containing protein [Pontibacter akesuensis]|uniref:Uncharacterized membrane protein YhaH, DUF805 family n=1 Tax=Pontibacter akesuensis TaxID=388950 RepID=A0A1I7KUU9_9BACT|nr:DUF805 domain-containing protein [Pontibacter akesuensis]GHA78395.1 hypothetical protein GCM10007389_35640 [Pontibacter akesuensis]SFV01158.1 Uncharacterized membrane protein YhaH, DUF805 family [Pontibacter akesuensis]
MSNIFSFSGRIRRTEYAVTHIILTTLMSVIFFVFGVSLFAGESAAAGATIFFVVAMLMASWISLASGAKRCHDRGNSGFFQLIPFYGLWMLFGDGDHGSNYYGNDPKGRISQADMYRAAVPAQEVLVS